MLSFAPPHRYSLSERAVIYSEFSGVIDATKADFDAERWSYTSVAVTNARADGGQFIPGVRTAPGLPYDGHTLKDQIAQVERLTGAAVARVYVDKGYRGHGLSDPDIHITQSPSRRTPTIKRELRRRSAIEAIIGHTKSDGLLERNRLAGAKGDAINAILVGSGHNIRLLLAWLRVLLPLLLAFAASALSTRNSSPQSR